MRAAIIDRIKFKLKFPTEYFISKKIKSRSRFILTKNSNSNVEAKVVC